MKYLTGLWQRTLTVALMLVGLVSLSACGITTQSWPLGSEFQRQLDLADQLSNDGRNAEAVAILQQASSQAPNEIRRAEALYRLGNAFLATDVLYEAESAFGEAIVRDPRRSDALTGLGITLALSDNVPEAEVHLTRAVDMGQARAFSPLGVVLDLQGRHVEAQALYLKGLTQLPYSRELSANLALSYAFAGDYGQALAVSGPLSRLIVPDRYKRNHLLILAMAGRAEEAYRVAPTLGLTEADVESVLAVATRLRTASDPNRLAEFRTLTL